MNPKITKDTAGVYWLQWTPDPTAEGYAFKTPGGSSRTFDPALSKTKLGKPPEPVVATVAALDVTSRPAETATYPSLPPAEFGSKLYEGYEWCQEPAGGRVATVHSNSELQAAINSPANDQIDGAGLTFDPGQITLPAHSSGFRVLRNLTLERSRVLKTNKSKWRLAQITCRFGIPEDDVKGSQGGYLHLVQCDIGHSPRQGMLLYPHDDVVAEHTRYHHNGSAVDVNLDHGLYAGQGRRYLGIRNTHAFNYAYAAQYYPGYHDTREIQATYYGGVSRGGAVFGSEKPVGPVDPTATSNIRWIGCISAASPAYGWTQYKQANNCTVEYCVGWDNRPADYTLGFTPVGFVHGDPKFVDPTNNDFRLKPGSAAIGIIPQPLWPYVTNANAGAGAAA